jgi:hypothetical protein
MSKFTPREKTINPALVAAAAPDASCSQLARAPSLSSMRFAVQPTSSTVNQPAQVTPRRADHSETPNNL